MIRPIGLRVHFEYRWRFNPWILRPILHKCKLFMDNAAFKRTNSTLYILQKFPTSAKPLVNDTFFQILQTSSQRSTSLVARPTTRTLQFFLISLIHNLLTFSMHSIRGVVCYRRIRIQLNPTPLLIIYVCFSVLRLIANKPYLHEDWFSSAMLLFEIAPQNWVTTQYKPKVHCHGH